jgi:hypothetical protein
MKMKEKKTEEVIEEVVDVNDTALDYLKKARERIHQYAFFIKASKVCCGYCTKSCDDVLEFMGINVANPVTIKTGYNKETVGDAFSEFISDWIDEYNGLDLSKIDNYTKIIIDSFLPLPSEIVNIKKAFKKCEQ